MERAGVLFLPAALWHEQILLGPMAKPPAHEPSLNKCALLATRMRLPGFSAKSLCRPEFSAASSVLLPAHSTAAQLGLAQVHI